MRTFATSVVAAVILAATTSSPTFADGDQENVQLGSSWSCLLSAIRCVRPRRPARATPTINVGRVWNGARWNGKVWNGSNRANPPKRRIVRRCQIGSAFVVIDGQQVRKPIYGPCR